MYALEVEDLLAPTNLFWGTQSRIELEFFIFTNQLERSVLVIIPEQINFLALY